MSWKVTSTGYQYLAQNCTQLETLKINNFTRLSDQHLRVNIMIFVLLFFYINALLDLSYLKALWKTNEFDWNNHTQLATAHRRDFQLLESGERAKKTENSLE